MAKVIALNSGKFFDNRIIWVQKEALPRGVCVGIYPGQYYDAETGLHYNFNRYYDPAIGRYLRVDPAGDGLNPYVYVRNNPLVYFDPLGLCSRNSFQIPYFATFRTDNGNLSDWLYAFYNIPFNIGNDVIRLYNNSANNIGYLSDIGLGNYSAAVYDYWRTSLKATYLDSIEYHWTTPGKRQLDDTLAVLSSPDAWSRAATAAIETVEIGKLISESNGAVSSFNDFENISSETGLGANPFKGKTPIEIDEMLKTKGFEPRGPNPVEGKGGYVNTKTERSYHIDQANSYGERPVDFQIK